MSSLRHLALFLTESCNLACPYCFAANMERRPIDPRVARKALDMAVGPENRAKRVSITFWGGEPLLCFDSIRSLVAYARDKAGEDKKVTFALPTNLTLLTDEMVDFFQEHGVQLSLSLDGDEAAQGLRKTRAGHSSFSTIEEKLCLVKDRYGSRLPGVRMTVSPATAGEFEKNVRFFLDRGFTHVYFSPVVEADWPNDALEELETQQRRVSRIWTERIAAGRPVSFPTWDRALAWNELTSRGDAPGERSVLCGAGTSMLAVDIFGEVYPCHRFVFYDKEERIASLGNVSDGTAGRAVEQVPSFDPAGLGSPTTSCAECRFSADCFLVCPALNYALCGDVHRIDERLCRFSAMEHRIVAAANRRMGDDAPFGDHIERVMKLYAPGAVSGSVAALFGGLDASHSEDLLDRAEKILEDLQARKNR